jgi:hypothetical protein
MSSPQVASAAKPSLARDWLDALRYWLGGRRGMAALIVSAVVIGGALNWSWLVAAGIAPLLLTFLPCAAMCALGLCMNRMSGGSCSTSSSGSDAVGTPTPDVVQRLATSEPAEGAPVSPISETGPLPGYHAVDDLERAPDRKPHVQKERE